MNKRLKDTAIGHWLFHTKTEDLCILVNWMIVALKGHTETVYDIAIKNDKEGFSIAKVC